MKEFDYYIAVPTDEETTLLGPFEDEGERDAEAKRLRDESIRTTPHNRLRQKYYRANVPRKELQAVA